MKTFKIFILLMISLPVSAQIRNIIPGIGIGLSQIESNSPSQTAVNLQLNLKFKTYYFDDLFFNLRYSIDKKADYFLPNRREVKYYSSLNYFSLTGEFSPSVNQTNFSYEIGPMLIKDNIYSDRKIWSLGITFGIEFQFYPPSLYQTGVNYSIKVNYGTAFTGYVPSYTAVGLTINFNLISKY